MVIDQLNRKIDVAIKIIFQGMNADIKNITIETEQIKWCEELVEKVRKAYQELYFGMEVK